MTNRPAATYTLPRTGDVALTFAGTLIAKVSSQQPRTKRDAPLERRWHELALYRTTGGKHVAHIAYLTNWPSELGDSLVAVGTLSEVVEQLRGYDPCASVAGFPPGRGFADRQARLLDAIELGYDTALSTLLAGTQASEVIE